ncbi:MAG TPA: S8 family serine peptidase [Caulobacteraceae bacterium]|nr:S8 family serine peptidase [Caulobacteraceae bacterium]
MRLLVAAGVAVFIAAAALAAPAEAQLLGPAGPLGQVAGGMPGIGQTLERAGGDVLGRAGRFGGRTLTPGRLLAARARRLARFIRFNSRYLEGDGAGDPVVRGEVLVLSPTPAALQAALTAGFALVRQVKLGALGLAVAILGAPPGVSAPRALRRLRRLDPTGAFDFNHIYFGAGAAARPAWPAGLAKQRPAPGLRVGLIDTGVATSLPMFAGVRSEARGFAPGAPSPAAHGTATASLISGRLGGFRGAAPGASLYLADIYGTTPAGGSAEALAEALDWMVEVGAPVINVSLVGPPNLLVGAAVRAASARGARIVAPVGNDGPAAPPAYPASYPQVIAVIPVNGEGRVLPEAGDARHVEFAAPGAGLYAADLAGGLAPVRGSSFAAPIVAGRLARLLRRENPADAARAVAELGREARPAGPSLGYGLLGANLGRADGRP